MRSVKYTYRGESYTLAATAAALFTIYDKYGTGDIFEQTGCMEPTLDGWTACCDVAALLSEQGELQRRALGRDRAPTLKAEYLCRTASPTDALNVREAIREALRLGFARDIPENEDEEVNLVLLEREAAEKKTKRPERSAHDGWPWRRHSST